MYILLKYFLKEIISVRIIGNLIEKFLFPFFKAYNIIYRINNLQLSKSSSENLKLSLELKSKQELLKENLVVRNGIFKGMIYNNAESAGSAFFPKLLGSYEKELHKVFENLIKKDYEIVVDVGCAEGYYAIGLARFFKNKKAKIIAYDNDEKARFLCNLNAKINDVDIKINDFCDASELERLCSSNYALIIIDAEGYELKILNKNIINKLKHCDFLIESHDFININATEYLINCFKETHKIEIIESIDDISKAYQYNFPELQNLSLKTKFDLLKENRPTIMKWVYAESNSK